MRASALLSALLLSVPMQAGTLAAQATTDEETPSARLARALHTQVRATPTPPTWKSRVLSAVGGAAIGAGLGYFVSQLETGDWETKAQQGAVNRPAWAAVGGTLGLAVGFSFPLSARGRPADARPLPTLQRFTISRDELEELGQTHAYEAVEVLRPEWLHDRGPREWGDTPADGRSVYVDGTKIGNLAELRSLSTSDIEAIRFIEASTATSRWGAGNSRGAILVVLRGA